MASDPGAAEAPASPPAPPRSVFGIEDDRPLKVEGGRCAVCSVEELPPGTRKIFTSIGMRGRGIGVFNVDGRYYAVRNLCPHRGAPVCYGRVRPHVVGPAVHAIEFEREGEILKCPWHQWEFDLATGESLYAEGVSLRTYPVVVEDGRVVVVLS